MCVPLWAALPQMFADGSTPDFIPVTEWLREVAVYNRMHQIPVFRNYLALRMLRAWHHVTSAMRFRRVRRVIGQQEGRTCACVCVWGGAADAQSVAPRDERNALPEGVLRRSVAAAGR
eukprot:358481-Chlamydomonas_euryale.AAC.2